MNGINLDTIIKHARRFLSKASTKGLYIALLLYFAYRGPNVPSWAKKIIIGSLAYFVSPLDSIPDLTPILGMTDDMGILAFGIVTISCYVTEETKEKALYKLEKIMNGQLDEDAIIEVDSWL